MDTPRYQPFWCEENVWHLCADPRVPPGPRAVVFISNPDRTVAFLHQREGSATEPVVWDYHVVLAAKPGESWTIWDLDTRLPLPVALERWLRASFALPNGFPPELAPRFRVVPAEAFRSGLKSDRGHMRTDDGSWRAPPPPWPAIVGGTDELATFIDVAAPGPGVVVDLAGLPAALAAIADQSSKRP